MADMGLPKAVGSRQWLILALAALGLLAATVLFVCERVELSTTTTPAPRTAPAKSNTGTFPPAFTDLRPDLSSRTDYVDVCGAGRVRVRPDGQLDLPEDMASGQRLLDTATSSLAASRNDGDRALALYIKAGLNSRNVTEGLGFRDEWRQELARLAIASRDPVAYFLAFRVCGTGAPSAPTDGACTQISASHWALLDPDNAVPWLHEADAAQRRNDPRGVDEALRRASQAKTMEPYMFTPLRLMDSPAIRSAPPPTAQAALVDLVGIMAALPLPNLQLVMQYCAANAKGAAERAQVCNGLAEVLAERSTVLIGMAVGVRIGEQVGWPRERVAAVKTRLATLQEAQAKAVDLKDLYSCGALERSRRYFIDLARYGEIGAMETAAATRRRETK
jgi:hypothetical protein